MVLINRLAARCQHCSTRGVQPMAPRHAALGLNAETGERQKGKGWEIVLERLLSDRLLCTETS